ncbi:MAG: hypothetical protein CMJ64_06715 [Planctomycetaceae bacterium]|nr:hypothetical protein [Planctomycetaceae bacterium]
MRRHLLGIFGICFLIGWICLLWVAHDDDSRWVAAICMRVGFTLVAIWLAFPQAIELAQRFPPWLLACIGFGTLIVIVRPRALIYVLPGLGAIAVLQFVGWLFKPLPDPKKRKRSGPRSRQEQ